MKPDQPATRDPQPATASWYETWFDQDAYELVYPHRDLAEAAEAVDLIERIAGPEAGAHVLDVGCGRGRHARVLARRGYHVTGLDLSARAIERARARAAEEGLKEGRQVRFERHDMRLPFCTGCADGVVNLFSSFGYFQAEADHQRAVDAMAAALVPGGFLVQDFLNAPHVRRTHVPEDERTGRGVTIRQRRWVEDGRINKTITLRSGEEERTFRESVRLLALEDFRRLYEKAGLELQATFGHYDGRPHADDSPRLILYALRA